MSPGFGQGRDCVFSHCRTSESKPQCIYDAKNKPSHKKYLSVPDHFETQFSKNNHRYMTGRQPTNDTSVQNKERSRISV